MQSGKTAEPANGARSRPTMADLARLAGVSKITISRALADSPLVNDTTKARIQELARAHGYALNVSARNLRLRRSHTIAVVVEMPASPERPMSGPYPLELLGGIMQELTGAGYSALLSAGHDSITPATQSADGVILLGQGAHEDAVRTIERWQLPMVVWGAQSGSRDHVVVGSDNVHGGASVARHFLELGRQRPCFMGSLEHAENAERFAGFSETLAGQGISPDVIDDVDFTAVAGARAMQAFLTKASRPPDAVFACSDLLAMGAIQALRGEGLSIPDQVSVVGYDDTAVGATLVPALSSVHQDLYQAGILLARKLLKLIAGQPEQSDTLPTRLVVRGT